MKKILFAIALAGSVFFYSCSKQNISSPAPASTQAEGATTSFDEQNAVALASPAPGMYKVKLYIDDNDTSTRTFNGYVFTFKSNGVLTATKNNTTYRGTWQMKDGGTEMKIGISGTPALEQINKSWNVASITNSVIKLTDNDQGELTKLVFQRI